MRTVYRAWESAPQEMLCALDPGTHFSRYGHSMGTVLLFNFNLLESSTVQYLKRILKKKQ